MQTNTGKRLKQGLLALFAAGLALYLVLGLDIFNISASKGSLPNKPLPPAGWSEAIVRYGSQSNPPDIIRATKPPRSFTTLRGQAVDDYLRYLDDYFKLFTRESGDWLHFDVKLPPSGKHFGTKEITFSLDDIRYDVVNQINDCQLQQTFEDNPNDLRIDNPEPAMKIPLASAHHQRYFCFKISLRGRLNNNYSTRPTKVFAIKQPIRYSVDNPGYHQAVTLDTYYDRQLFNWKDDLGETALGITFLTPGLFGLAGKATKGAVSAATTGGKAALSSSKKVKVWRVGDQWVVDDGSGIRQVGRAGRIVSRALGSTIKHTDVNGLKTVALARSIREGAELSKLPSNINTFYLGKNGRFILPNALYIRQLPNVRQVELLKEMQAVLRNSADDFATSAKQLTQDLADTYWTRMPRTRISSQAHPSGKGQQFLNEDPGFSTRVWVISRGQPTNPSALNGAAWARAASAKNEVIDIPFYVEAALFNHNVTSFPIDAIKIGATKAIGPLTNNTNASGIRRLVALPASVTNDVPVNYAFTGSGDDFFRRYAAGGTTERANAVVNKIKDHLGKRTFEAANTIQDLEETIPIWTKVQSGVRGWTMRDPSGNLRVIKSRPSNGEVANLDIWAVSSRHITHPAEAVAFNHGIHSFAAKGSFARTTPVRIASGGGAGTALATFTMLPFLTAMSSGDVSEGAGVSGNQEHSDSRSLLDHYPSLHLTKTAKRTAKTTNASVLVTLPRRGQHGKYSLSKVSYVFVSGHSQCSRQLFENVNTGGVNRQGNRVRPLSQNAIEKINRQINAAGSSTSELELIVYDLPLTVYTKSHIRDHHSPFICFKVEVKVDINNRGDQHPYRIFAAPNPIPIGTGL